MTEIIDQIIVQSRSVVFDMKNENKKPKKITVHLSKMNHFIMKEEIKYLPYFACLSEEEKKKGMLPNQIFGIACDYVVGDVSDIAVVAV